MGTLRSDCIAWWRSGVRRWADMAQRRRAARARYAPPSPIAGRIDICNDARHKARKNFQRRGERGCGRLRTHHRRQRIRRARTGTGCHEIATAWFNSSVERWSFSRLSRTVRADGLLDFIVFPGHLDGDLAGWDQLTALSRALKSAVNGHGSGAYRDRTCRANGRVAAGPAHGRPCTAVGAKTVSRASGGSALKRQTEEPNLTC